MIQSKKTGWGLIILGILVIVLVLTITSFYEMSKTILIPISITLFAIVHSGIALLNIQLPDVKRKKNANRIFIVSIVLIVLYYLFKRNRWPGANILIVESTFLLAFSYAPLIVKGRYDKWKNHTKNKILALVLSISDFVGVLCILMGLLSRAQHWPFANSSIAIGIIFILLAAFGWNQVFKREVLLRKEAEEKLKEAFEELENKHKIIEEKQKEIIDSILYAKRIQQSLLPTESYIQRTITRLLK